jgi:2-iminobutanoate/2-iminopropanoate deaminase
MSRAIILAAVFAKGDVMERIHSDDAPKAIGPYSQAIKVGNVIYTSGQVSLDPATGEIVAGDFNAQARRTFNNLASVLSAAGAGFQDVVKANVYLTDLANFQALNAVYAEVFGDHKPARTTVQVSALPKGAALEIDLIAMV